MDSVWSPCGPDLAGGPNPVSRETTCSFPPHSWIRVMAQVQSSFMEGGDMAPPCGRKGEWLSPNLNGWEGRGAGRGCGWTPT